MARYNPRDKYYRKAREAGLPSRAAYKLEELIARFRLVRAGSRVLDLGCAPGGWLAIAARAVGPQGKVVGVDLVECVSPAVGVVTIAGDIRDPAILDAARVALGGAADLIASDMAPKLSGIRDRDDARCAELIDVALEAAASILKPGGAMIAKTFMSGQFPAIQRRFTDRFDNVESVRSQATRPGSSELYVIARGFMGAQ
jgi:23S rRNA (uridine2552-2'-O)-methyltransferase